MKKLLAVILVGMLLVLSACNNDAPQNQTIVPNVDADTLGGKLWDVFCTGIAENPNATAEELAVKIADSGIAPYSLSGMPLSTLASPNENGELYLQGFGNYNFAGLDTEKSAIFLPMIGSAFVGYIFELPDGTDAESFIKTLEENANLRWQICVSAEQMVVGSVGNKVFFVMCRTTVEDQPENSGSAFPGTPLFPGIPIN